MSPTIGKLFKSMNILSTYVGMTIEEENLREDLICLKSIC